MHNLLLINILKTLLDNNKIIEVKEMLEKIVKAYKSNSKIVDHMYIEQISKINDEKISSIYDLKVK